MAEIKLVKVGEASSENELRNPEPSTSQDVEQCVETRRRVQFNIYPEICCDYCNEVIHNHMACPVCNKTTGTDAYYDLYSALEDDELTISCEECKTEFKCIDHNNELDKWVWEIVKG